MKTRGPIGFTATPREPDLPHALTIQGQRLRLTCFGPNWLVVDRGDFERVLNVLTNSTWTIREPEPFKRERDRR